MRVVPPIGEDSRYREKTVKGPIQTLARNESERKSAAAGGEVANLYRSPTQDPPTCLALG